MKIFLLLVLSLVGAGAKSTKPKSLRPAIPEHCLEYIPDIIYILPDKEKTNSHLKRQKWKSRSRRFAIFLSFLNSSQFL